MNTTIKFAQLNENFEISSEIKGINVLGVRAFHFSAMITNGDKNVFIGVFASTSEFGHKFEIKKNDQDAFVNLSLAKSIGFTESRIMEELEKFCNERF